MTMLMIIDIETGIKDLDNIISHYFILNHTYGNENFILKGIVEEFEEFVNEKQKEHY